MFGFVCWFACRTFSIPVSGEEICLLALSCDHKKTVPGQVELCDCRYSHFPLIIKHRLPKAASMKPGLAIICLSVPSLAELVFLLALQAVLSCNSA